MKRIGIADTTFARVDMGGVAETAVREYAKARGVEVAVERVTVPGFKDLPVAAKKLIEERKCDIVLACGWAGPEPIDKQCAHEASQGIQMAQILTNTHVLEVFFHADECETDADRRRIAAERAREHAVNACWMLFEPERLRKLAGTGQRQGFVDEGGIP